MEKENMELEQVLTSHAKKYPQMRPCDGVKLIFQNEFGGGHLITDRRKALERLRKEYDEVSKTNGGTLLEEIGNGLVRVRLEALRPEQYSLEELCEDFTRSASLHTGNKQEFLNKLEVLKKLTARGIFGFSTEDLEEYLENYIASGCPPVSHSEVYREAYRPAYRVVLGSELSCLPTERAAAAILQEVEQLRNTNKQVVVAIDGRCASGKTTLAARLAELLDCSLVHMDDFFLRPEQRTAERYAQPGGNVDRERFLAEVLLPLRRGESVVYRPFDCGTQRLREPVALPMTSVTVVEGSYSCHPELAEYYDLKVFLTVKKEEQMARIVDREGPDYAQVFREKWIPLEERYFETLQVEKKCEVVFDTTDVNR